MSQQLHAQANALLYRALEQAPSERHRFIEQACAGCRELFQLVTSMLSHIDQLDAFLDEPLAASVEEAPEAAARPGVGDTIGHWRITGEADAGRLGKVLLVEREHAGARQSAVLKIVDAAALSLEQLALFHRQRQLLASLTHPDIARLLDSGALPDGDPYLVLEHSDGQPIDAFCAATGATREARIALLARASLAVHHGHQHLVLHRHLDPASILVEPDGALKVVGFGVSGLFDAAPATAATGEDIRALGAVLRKLLLDEGGRLPDALDQIVERAASADPHIQYGSADQLARALHAWLEPEPAPQPDAIAPRRPLARAISAALLVAAGAGAALAWQQMQPAAPKQTTAASASPRPAPRPAAPVQPPSPQIDGMRLIEQGEMDKGIAQLRAELAARQKSAADAPGAAASVAVAQSRVALAHGLVASGAYAAAESEYRLARDAYAALPASGENRIAIAEIDLARAKGQCLRKHWRTAGQTVRAMRAALPPDADSVLHARAALLEALIQPGGTAAQAYASARRALPVLLADFEADPGNLPKLRDSALAWRHTGDIALRAEQKQAACDYYGLAEKRYAELEARASLTALDRAARQQLASAQAACR